jgi:AcrR family transcriptional regulator
VPEEEKPAPYSRPRRSRSEGEIALLEAAFELMREKHPSEVTTGDIAERAGLNRAHIVRYFGTRLELLSAAIEYAFHLHLAPEPPPDVFNKFLHDGNIANLMNLRHKVVSYLLNSEVPPERFRESQRIIIDRFSQVLNTGDLSDRMSRTLAIISVLLTQGYQAYGELDELTVSDRDDMFMVMTQINKLIGPLDKELGWK